MVTAATHERHRDAWCPVHFTHFCGECEAPLHHTEDKPAMNALCVHPLGHTADCPDAGKYLVGQGTSWPCTHCPGAGAIDISEIHQASREARPWMNYVATDAEDKLMHQLEHHEETNRCLRLQIENRSDLNHAKTTALRAEKRSLEKKAAELQAELDRTSAKPHELSLISAALEAVKSKMAGADSNSRGRVQSRMEPASEEALRDMRFRIKQCEEVIARLDAELLAAQTDVEDVAQLSEEQMHEQTTAMVGQVRALMTRITTPLDSPEIANELEKSIAALSVLVESQKVDNEKVRTDLESATAECRRLPASNDSTARAIVEQRKAQLLHALRGDTVKELVAKKVKLDMTNRLVERDALFQPNLEVMGLQEHVDELRRTKLDRAKRLEHAIALRDAMRKDLTTEIEMSDYSLAKRRLIYDEFVVTKHLLLGRMEIAHKLLASKEKEMAKREADHAAFSIEFRRAYRIARFHQSIAESKLLLAQRELEAVKAERASLMTWPSPLDTTPAPQATAEDVGLCGISLRSKAHDLLTTRIEAKMGDDRDAAVDSDVTTAVSDHAPTEPPTARTARTNASPQPHIARGATSHTPLSAKPSAASSLPSSAKSEIDTIFSSRAHNPISKAASDAGSTMSAASDNGSDADESSDLYDMEDTLACTKQRYKWLTCAPDAAPTASSDAEEVRDLTVALFAAGAPATDFVEPARECAFSPCYPYFRCTLTEDAARHYQCAPDMFVGVNAALRPNERITLAKTYSTASIRDGARRLEFDSLVRFMPVCKGVVNIQGRALHATKATPQTLLLVENLRPHEDYRVLEAKLSPPRWSMHTATQFPSAAAHKQVSDYFAAQTKLYAVSNFGQEGFAFDTIVNPPSSFVHMTSQHAASATRATFIRSMPSHQILPHFFDLRYGTEADVERVLDQVLEQMSDLVQAVRDMAVPQFMQGVSLGLCVGATNSDLPVKVRLFNFEYAEIVMPSKWDAYVAENFASTDIKQQTRHAVWQDFITALTRFYYNLCSYHHGRFMCPLWTTVRVEVYSTEWKPVARAILPIKDGAVRAALRDGKNELAELSGSFSTSGPTFRIMGITPLPPKFADHTLLLTFFENVEDARVEDVDAHKMQAKGRVTLRFTGYTQSADAIDTVQLITHTVALRLRRTDCVSMQPFDLTTMPLDFPMRERPMTALAYQKYADRVKDVDDTIGTLGRRYRIFVKGHNGKASLGLQVFVEDPKSSGHKERILVSATPPTGLLSTLADPRKDDVLLLVNGFDRFEDMAPALKNLKDGVELIFSRPKKRYKKT